ncbi:MAG: LCP family protein [Clostridia bacterium]|nr:LCP family protein [Clostridia bacterium]
MSSINERRQRTAEMEIENKAKLAETNEAEVKQGSSAKKFLMAILVIAIIVAIALLVINAVIDSYANAFAEVDIDNAQATATIDKLPQSAQDFYGSWEDSIKTNSTYKNMHIAAIENYAYASSNIKTSENVNTYAIFVVNDVTADAKAAGTILLASVNKSTNKVTYATIDTRTLVYIPSADVVGPMADAYLWGGAPLLARTIKNNYGVDINGYVEMGFSVVSKLISSYGGVNINVSEDVAAAMNAEIALYNELDAYKGENAVKTVSAGSSVNLDGMQVVAYIRSNGTNKNAAIADVVKGLVPSMLSGGFNGLKTTLDIAKDSVNASIPREDFGMFIQLALAAQGALNDGTAEVGTATRINFHLYTDSCDYATERTALQSLLYGTK